MPGLDIAAGLKRIDDNKWLYRQLLIDFARKYSVVTEEIAEHIKEDDLAEAERIAHTLKGSAGNLGFRYLAKAATDFEKATKTSEGDFPTLAAALDNAITLSLAWIEEWRKRH